MIASEAYEPNGALIKTRTQEIATGDLGCSGMFTRFRRALHNLFNNYQRRTSARGRAFPNTITHTFSNPNGYINAYTHGNAVTDPDHHTDTHTYSHPRVENA